MVVDPNAPRLFAAVGTYLRRFNPPCTPVYFWKRLDKEWDLAHKTHGRRLVVNFVEAPSDLSLTLLNPRRRDNKPLHYLERETISMILPMHRVNFIEITPSQDTEEVDLFFRA